MEFQGGNNKHQDSVGKEKFKDFLGFIPLDQTQEPNESGTITLPPTDSCIESMELDISEQLPNASCVPESTAWHIDFQFLCFIYFVNSIANVDYIDLASQDCVPEYLASFQVKEE